MKSYTIPQMRNSSVAICASSTSVATTEASFESGGSLAHGLMSHLNGAQSQHLIGGLPEGAARVRDQEYDRAMQVLAQWEADGGYLELEAQMTEQFVSRQGAHLCV